MWASRSMVARSRGSGSRGEAVVDGEDAQHRSLERPDRRGPAGADPEFLREGEIRHPQRVRRHVADHHALPGVGGEAAGRRVRADVEPLGDPSVGVGQTRRRAEAQAGVRFVHHENGGAGVQLLRARAGEQVEHVGERCTAHGHFEGLFLGEEQAFRTRSALFTSVFRAGHRPIHSLTRRLHPRRPRCFGGVRSEWAILRRPGFVYQQSPLCLWSEL